MCGDHDDFVYLVMVIMESIIKEIEKNIWMVWYIYIYIWWFEDGNEHWLRIIIFEDLWIGIMDIRILRMIHKSWFWFGVDSNPVVYKLALPKEFTWIHNVFHVSMLRKYIFDSTHILKNLPKQIEENLTCEETTDWDFR